MPRAEAGRLGDVVAQHADALWPGVQVEVTTRPTEGLFFVCFV
jgi:hypothetical protein